jgi:hypothetical protein
LKVTKLKDTPLYWSYYRPERFEAYKGMPYLKCTECGKCSPIPFDMEIHLHDHMRSFFGDYANEMYMNDHTYDGEIELMKQEAIRVGRYFGCDEEQE